MLAVGGFGARRALPLLTFGDLGKCRFGPGSASSSGVEEPGGAPASCARRRDLSHL